MNQTTVDLICINDTLEAIAVRAALDYWGVNGRLHLIGKASDLVALLNGSYPLSQYVILFCHGIEEGIVLPELAEEIARQEPYDKVLSPENIAEFAHLPDVLILNTGCVTGTPAFADAFLQHGATNYIAPSDYPEGNASLMFSLSFSYHFLVKGIPLQEAHERAQRIDNETGMFQLFQR